MINWLGIMILMANGPIQAWMQTRVEPGMQGRVMTLVSSCAGAMTPIGIVLAAPISRWLGIQAWFIATGILTTCMGVLGCFLPVVMHIEDDMPLAVPVSEPELVVVEN